MLYATKIYILLYMMLSLICSKYEFRKKIPSWEGEEDEFLKKEWMIFIILTICNILIRKMKSTKLYYKLTKWKKVLLKLCLQSIFVSDSRIRLVPENLISGTSICDPSLIDSSFLAKKLAIYLPAICIFVCLSAPSEIHTLKNHQIIAKNFEKKAWKPYLLVLSKKKR